MRYNKNDILRRWDSMEFQANDYKPEEICRIMREWTDLDRKEFGKNQSTEQNEVLDLLKLEKEI